MSEEFNNVINLENIKAYELIQKEELQDIRSLGLLFRHKKTGARVAVISNDDNNKVFSIGFRTPPENSKGTPHIIEHSVLCGSRQFPSKDPFVELAKGSLNTFLNAITFPDKTIYPIASCNDKDFQNLMHVYLDAVFYPNIYKEEKIFMQEGWHYELENKDDPLAYNGVVYNEMKGAFSSPEQQLFRSILNSLFPDSAYGVESGGDPTDIPKLSYEEFLDFHRKYYHPTNSYIYLYGDMDVEEKLDWINDNYLDSFDEEPVDSAIRLQEPFTKIREIKQEYSLSEDEDTRDNTYLSYNLVLTSSLDVETTMAMEVLEHALISAPGAPLKQALLDAKIGKDILSSYDSELYQTVLSIIAKNSEEDKKDEFLQIIKETLRKVIDDGIDNKSIAAAINSLEFMFREADFGSYPKGLMYGKQSYATWIYDDSKPFVNLSFDVFESLKEKIGTDYYPGLVKKYLLDNTHASVVILTPKPGLTNKIEEDIKEELAAHKASLSEEEINQIIEETKSLMKYQEEPSSKEDMEKIPMLSIDDIDKEAKSLYIEEKEIEGFPIIHHNVFTNGIAYLRFLFSLENIPKSLTPYISLLSTVLGYIDTEHYTYSELSNEVNIHTGGINNDIVAFSKKGSATEYTPAFSVDVKVLYGNMDNAFDLLKEIISFTILNDEKRLLEIIKETKSRTQMYLTSAGHSAAVSRATSYFSEVGRYNEVTTGISYFRFIQGLESDFENVKTELIEKLEQLMIAIFRKENLIVSFTSDETGLETLKGRLVPFVEQLKQEPIEKITENFELHQLNEGFKTSGQIQYVARAGNYIDAGYEYTGALEVLKVILSYGYLWNNVRVKGGAYGAMCGFSRLNGNSFFTSYRDPNLKETNEIYNGIYEYLRTFDADDRDMTKYVIGTISNIDRPLTPRAKGTNSLAAYMTGTTAEDLQKQRDDILEVSKDDIRSLSEMIRAILDTGNICVIGSENKIEENEDLFTEVKQLI